MSLPVTAYVEWDPATRLFVATVPGLPGAHSQGATLDELLVKLREVIELIVDDRKSRGEAIEIEPFVGIQQISVSV